PKPKASARRKRGGSDSSTTPPTAVASSRPIITVVVAPRLTATAKGKQPARATSPIDPSEVERSEAEQLKIVLRRSRQETHISQHGGSGIDEGTDDEDDGNGEEDQGLRISEEERIQEEEEANELYHRVKSLEVNFSKFMQTNQFAEAVSRIPDKTILESYGDTTVLKRRRGDDDDQKGPSAGSDQGSKRRREGGEPESASTSFEPTTRSASRSTTGTQSR
nr:hypothetical protein [Tanacetum cinerariifolium]